MSFSKHSKRRDEGTVTTMMLFIGSNNTTDELQSCLDAISNPLFDPTIERFELSLTLGDITPTFLDLLVQILNQPLRKAPTGMGSKWDCVRISTGTFERPGMTLVVADDEGFCSQDKIQLFASALAHRTSTLCLHGMPEILECLFNTRNLELKEFWLWPTNFSALECARIGFLVQSCSSLQDLHFGISSFEEPVMVGQGLANASHLQSVSFSSIQDPFELVKGGSNSLLGQLLCPSSRLQKLELDTLYLDDSHFLPIVEMLPTSQLQVLDVAHNYIRRKGVLAFASQLPRIKYLKEVNFYYNPWEHVDYLEEEYEEWYRECIAALLQGMFENYSIECFHLFRWREELEYCTHANWVRGQILATGNSIPIELWPLILEQVGTNMWNSDWDENWKFRNYRATTLYFMLQNSPIVSSHSLRSSSKKRKRTYQGSS